jgi:hypothetical protein
MKEVKLHNFLKTISRADAIVLINGSAYDLINFNDKVRVYTYQLFLEEKSQNAFFSHLANLTSSKGDSSIYLKSLQRQFENALSEFIDYDDFLIHKRLSIIDTEDQRLSFDDMSNEVKQKISSFISVQKSCLLCFLSKLDHSENQSPPSTLK